jgi:hypothetical protein
VGFGFRLEVQVSEPVPTNLGPVSFTIRNADDLGSVASCFASTDVGMNSPRDTGGVIRGGGRGPFQRPLHGGLAGLGGVRRSRRCPFVRRGAHPPEAVADAVFETTAAVGFCWAREACA